MRRGSIASLPANDDVRPSPRWTRPAAAAMMVLAAVLYLWNLTVNQDGNAFYAAAVRAGSKSWTAMLFGSIDANNSITVDKPPAAFWAPDLMARVFGFSSFTMLFPTALMGIATVWFLYLTVKRTSGAVAGLVAGTAMALTPVAVMMFRFNNPDGAMTLCLVLGAYFVVRALQARPGLRAAGWACAAGGAMGFAFLCKMMQGWLTLPALAIVLLWAAQGPVRKRLGALFSALLGLVVPVGAYSLVFALWPVGSRPYMAGTDGNSFWELALGYNGAARILGRGTDAGRTGGSGAASTAHDAATGAADAARTGAAAMGGGMGGKAGIGRLFTESFGTEIAWLLPAALILLVAGLWLTRRARRTDQDRAGLVLWGLSVVVPGIVYSFMQGTIHTYYTVSMAPAIAAVIGIGAVLLWSARGHAGYRWTLAAALAVTSAWGFFLTEDGASSWLVWLRWAGLVLGLLAAVAVGVVEPGRPAAAEDAAAAGTRRRRGRLGPALAVAALAVGLLPSGAWALATVDESHTGGSPAAGPAEAKASTGRGTAGTSGDRASGSWTGASGRSGSDHEGTGRSGRRTDGTGTSSDGTRSSEEAAGAGRGESAANAQITDLLKNTTSKYSAATVGANTAAAYMLSSNTEVLDIGGFQGSDPYPSLSAFQQPVKDGQVRYFLAATAGGEGQQGSAAAGQGSWTQGAESGRSKNTDGSQITAWVQQHYAAHTVGGVTYYDLTQAK